MWGETDGNTEASMLAYWDLCTIVLFKPQIDVNNNSCSMV